VGSGIPTSSELPPSNLRKCQVTAVAWLWGPDPWPATPSLVIISRRRAYVRVVRPHRTHAQSAKMRLIVTDVPWSVSVCQT